MGIEEKCLCVCHKEQWNNDETDCTCFCREIEKPECIQDNVISFDTLTADEKKLIVAVRASKAIHITHEDNGDFVFHVGASLKTTQIIGSLEYVKYNVLKFWDE